MAVYLKGEYPEEMIQKPHESKPIRAGIASIFSTPGYIAHLGGLASAGISKLNPFNDKTFAENLQDSSLFKAGTNWVNKTHDIIGVNRPEDQDKTEQTAAFVADLIPTIATLGTYGAAKMPATVASKVASKIGSQKVKKSLFKKFNKAAANIKNAQNMTNAQKVDALRLAKINVRETHAHPLLATRELMLPGIQIPRTNLLVKTNRIKGMSADEALKAARKSQLLTGGVQIGANVGAYEGLAALADAEGLIGDYRDEPETFDLEQQLDKEESNYLVPAVLLGLGGYVGAKYASKLMGNTVDSVKQANKKIADEANLIRQIKPNKEIKDTIASSWSDKTTIMDNPEFNYLFPDENVKGLIRADRPTEIQAMYNTGNVGHGIENTIPFREVDLELNVLRNENPELHQQIEDLLSMDNELQGTFHDLFIKGQKDIKHIDYSVFTRMDDYLKDPNMPNSLADYIIKRDNLYNSLIQNPQAKKVLDDVSKVSKTLLDLEHKIGKLNNAEYLYNLDNHTINGFFSYKPRIAAEVPDQTFKQFKDRLTFAKQHGTLSTKTVLNDPYVKQLFGNPFKKVNDFLFTKDVSKKSPSPIGFARTDFHPGMKTMPYTDVFEYMVKTTLNNATENSIKRTVLPRILATQEKYLHTRFNELLASRLKNFAGFKKLDVIRDTVNDADNATRVKYLGSRDVRIDSQTQAPTDVFNYLNKKKSYDNETLFENQFRLSQGNYKNTGNITRLIEQGGNPERNTKVLSFFTEDGREHFFEVHKLIGNMLDFAPESLSLMQNVFKSSKQTLQQFTTGNYNPMFAPRSAIFSAFEGLTALPVIMAENGLEYNMIKDSYALIRANIKAAKMRYTNQATQNIIDSYKRAKFIGDENNPILSKYTDDVIAKMEKDLHETFLSKAERAGAVTFKYSTELSDRTYKLNAKKPLNSKFIDVVNKCFGHKASQTLQMLGVVQECLRNAGNDGMLLLLAGKKGVMDVKELRQIADTISKNITDSKRVGNYSGFFGSFIGGVAKYVPYGNVMIQSLAAKLHAANAKGGYEFLKNAVKQVKNSDKKVIDIFAQLQIGAESLKNNKFVHGLVATAGIPAVICYLWNHSTDEKRNNYYKLSDYDKASQYIFTNFFGEGRHLSIPVDQEVGVVAKLVETMMDSVLLGSKMQDQDPAFEQQRLIMQALSRSLNIENLVYPEAILNMSGYQSNFGPSNVTGNSFISPLPPNQTNLDGSKTSIQDGIFSQEARATINTIFGSLGSALIGGTEQANIGARDVGMLQGAADFASGMSRPLLKSLPFIPMDNKFTLRSSNQTQQQNKIMQNTIQSLRKLRTFVENNNNSQFGRRSNGKVENVAAIRPLSPDLQYALQIANVAVPAYNERIAPYFDHISAIYKHVAAFNATGRDRFGNIVNADDRFTFQQKQNEKIQKIHAKIYEEFKNLEQQLTNTFNRDIALDNFDKLKGE